MNRYILIILILILSFNILQGQSNFDTIIGRQFYDLSGDPFFPVVMNYNVDVAFEMQQGNRVFKVCRSSNYGTQHCILEGHTFSDCETSLDVDFETLKSTLKFNTIRLLLRPRRKNGSLGFEIKTHEFNYFCENSSPLQYTIDLDPNSNYNSVDAQKYFQLVADVLDRANNVGIKVILLCASHADENYNEMGSSQVDADDYAQFLTTLAGYIHNKPALLAYDLYNEPAWNVDRNFLTQDKEEVCNFVAQWYDAIRSVDKYHLITIGCGDAGDVMSWDPGIMKVDFISMHLYPTLYEWEGYDFAVAKDRVVNQISWCSNNLQRPWIIGESGFSATADACLAHPYIDGNLSEQADFLETVLITSRDCGASGFSWWEFQDNHTYCVPPLVCSSCGFCEICPIGNTPSAPTEVHGNYWGLLDYSDPINGVYPSTAFKPAANVVIAFDGGNGTPVPSSCLGPTNNYYDPYLHQVFNPGPNNGSISGMVVDQNGNVIEGAVVLGWTFVTNYSNSDPFDDLIDVHYTFTNANGEFDIVPHDYISFGGITNSIMAMRLSSAGKSRYYYNWGPNGTIVNTILPSNNEYQIDDKSIDYDEILENLNLSTGTTTFNKGWNSLTIAGNVDAGANADFTARYDVNVNSEFQAHSGSEVHIYCSTIFNDCSIDFGSYNRTSFLSETEGPYQTKEIELNFGKKNMLFEIHPNPNNGEFTIVSNNLSKNSVLEVMDPVGKILKKIHLYDERSELNLTTFTKGIYFLRYRNLTRRIIIN